MRIESHSNGIDARRAKLRNIVDQLFVNEFEALAIILVFRFAVQRQRLFETIHYWNQSLNHTRSRTPGILGALLLHPLAVVIEIGLAAQQRLAQVFEILRKLA